MREPEAVGVRCQRDDRFAPIAKELTRRNAHFRGGRYQRLVRLDVADADELEKPLAHKAAVDESLADESPASIVSVIDGVDVAKKARQRLHRQRVRPT